MLPLFAPVMRGESGALREGMREKMRACADYVSYIFAHFFKLSGTNLWNKLTNVWAFGNSLQQLVRDTCPKKYNFRITVRHYSYFHFYFSPGADT